MKRRLIPVILSLHLTVTFFPLTNTEPSTEPSPQGGDGMDRVSSDEDVAVIPLGSEVPRSASSTPTEAQGASGPRTPGARGGVGGHLYRNQPLCQVSDRATGSLAAIIVRLHKATRPCVA